MTPTFQKLATGIAAAEFLEELDALLGKYGARLVIQRTHGEHSLQVRFTEDPSHALTLCRARPGKGAVVYAGDAFQKLGKTP